MHVIRARNVREAYYRGINFLVGNGIEEESRAGRVLVAQVPVTTVYMEPCERVLLDPRRNANPFFHVAEALWMLAGRRDVEFLNRYVRNFGERFAEEDGSVHDAYGYRWRRALGYDQLDHIISALRRDPATRQCVLQMWDAIPESPVSPGDESARMSRAHDGADDLRGAWKTRPCNTHVYFRVRDANKRSIDDHLIPRYLLDATICCRSNDMIMGGYGANAVHFSFLLEYVARMAGMQVGRMYQVSNNFHAYVSDLRRVLPVSYTRPEVQERPVALIDDPETFDDELEQLLSYVEDNSRELRVSLRNKFLEETALPMLQAYSHWRKGDREMARAIVALTSDQEWRRAALEWMGRREGGQDAAATDR